MQTTIYIGWINNKVLLYSMENCIPYPVINHMGNMKNNIHILSHITQSLCYTEKLIQHCKSTLLQ